MNQPAPELASQKSALEQPATGLRQISPQQWKSGLAAWLGWFFDGMELHIFTLVALPVVAQLMALPLASPDVKEKSSWIQGAFLAGWALGGAFFGRVGDRLGRSRALCLTILTYALFTGLCFFAQTWWQLLIFRFISALGIGGEWAIGASLLSETWPKKWRPWIAAVLQTGVNLGILIVCAFSFTFPGSIAAHPERIFLIGVVPALIVFWIRRNVPEPEEWHAAQNQSAIKPGPADLFRGEILSTTVLTTIVCALTLTGWWAFMFWHPQHLRGLPELASWSPEQRQKEVTIVFFWVVGVSIPGNYFAAWLAKRFGYRRTILALCLAFVAAFCCAYAVPRPYESLKPWLYVIGFCSGVFGLFTMYMPPLFPTLLRTTGAGFCYNIGRLFAAIGTVVFGLYLKVGDFQTALLAFGGLFMLAAVFAMFLPELGKEE